MTAYMTSASMLDITGKPFQALEGAPTYLQIVPCTDTQKVQVANI